MTNKTESKSTMLFSIGEKRKERFKRLADEKELSYSAVIQMLIDEWCEKNNINSK